MEFFGSANSDIPGLTLTLYLKSLVVDLKYVYRKSGAVHSVNNVW